MSRGKRYEVCSDADDAPGGPFFEVSKCCAVSAENNGAPMEAMITGVHANAENKGAPAQAERLCGERKKEPSDMELSP